MPKTLRQWKSELLDLPREDRVELVDALLLSLDEDETGDDEEVEQAWRDEIRRRVENFRAGKAEMIDNDDVLAELRARFG
jgi:putative addiction module component (TIGR02574 family)